MAANERRRNLHVARMLQAVALAVAFVLLLLPDLIAALKDVSVTIPQAVKRGSNALLVCNYDMENDTLYSVKWYKGRREFYRYTPKENPAMKVFPLTSGLDVERNLSNQSHVVLLSVALNVSGKFTCEISVEAPSFQTAMVSGEMEVVELPEQQATVTGIQPRYRIGDLVDGNCSIKFSKPAANLTWTINGIVVPPHHIKTYQIEKYDEHNLESVMSAINFMVTTQHFHKGQMKLKCTASIFNIYKEEIENVIEEDRPRIMASGRSYDMNAYPYDQHSSGDGFEDHNESYLTYYSAADMASSSAPRARSRYVELLRQWHRYWTNLLASASSSPKPAPSSGKEQTVVEDPAATTTETGSSNNTNVAASSLSSIKGNVKRFVDDISRRFKTQIENTMASMTSTVGPSRALMEEPGPSGSVPRRQEMEINTRRARRRGVSCKSSRSLALALATADVDDDEAGDTVDDDRWRPRRCTRNALLIAAVVLGVGCAGLSLVLLLGDLVAERPVKVMAADGAERGGRRKEAAAARMKELMKEDSRSCQNKARVRTVAKWQRETAPVPASASSWARALAWDPAAGAAAGAGRGPAVGPVDGFNDFLSRDHEYTLQEIQAMKSFYNCHGSNESGAETEAKCRRRDLRTLAKEAMTTTSTRTTTALTTSQSEDEAKEMKKNCHYALACQRQLSMMLLPSNNGEKYRNRNFAWSDDVADADADAVLTTMDCERVTKEELEVGGGRGGGGGGSRSLPVDGQVSKLPIMLRQRQRGRVQGGCQQC